MAFPRPSISLLLSGLILSTGVAAQAATVPDAAMVSDATTRALEGKWPAAWSYQGSDGPDHWGGLHPSYSKCSRGRAQSPVDLGKATTRSRRSTVRVAFRPIRYEVVHDGHGIRAVPLEAQHPLQVDRRDYTLKHIAFHAPSEHTFHGRHFPLEAQLVYEAEDGALAVLATVFGPGHSNPSLATLTRQPLAEGQRRTLEKPLGTRVLLPRRLPHLRLNGSLTTPPCTEGVNWIVFTRPVQATRAQIDAMTRLIGAPNNRPVQPFHGRLMVEETR